MALRIVQVSRLRVFYHFLRLDRLFEQACVTCALILCTISVICWPSHLIYRLGLFSIDTTISSSSVRTPSWLSLFLSLGPRWNHFCFLRLRSATLINLTRALIGRLDRGLCRAGWLGLRFGWFLLIGVHILNLAPLTQILFCAALTLLILIKIQVLTS